MIKALQMHRRHLTSQQKKAIALRGIDMKLIKKNIMKELYSSFKKEKYNNTSYNKSNNEYYIEQYEINYQDYLMNIFNSKCVSMINFYVKVSKNFPEELKRYENFSKKLISIIKALMMNEFEITLFTLNIDFYGWTNKIYKPEIYLLFLGLYTKQLSNKNCNYIFMKFKEENCNFIKCYQQWESSIKKKIFNLIEICQRLNFLNQPHNSFCQVNFIDFNCVVDKIINLSQPYGEDNQGSNLKVCIREENNFSKDNVKNNNDYNFDNILKQNSSFFILGESEKSLIPIHDFINDNIDFNEKKFGDQFL